MKPALFGIFMLSGCDGSSYAPATQSRVGTVIPPSEMFEYADDDRTGITPYEAKYVGVKGYMLVDLRGNTSIGALYPTREDFLAANEVNEDMYDEGFYSYPENFYSDHNFVAVTTSMYDETGRHTGTYDLSGCHGKYVIAFGRVYRNSVTEATITTYRNIPPIIAENDSGTENDSASGEVQALTETNTCAVWIKADT